MIIPFAAGSGSVSGSSGVVSVSVSPPGVVSEVSESGLSGLSESVVSVSVSPLGVVSAVVSPQSSSSSQSLSLFVVDPHEMQKSAKTSAKKITENFFISKLLKKIIKINELPTKTGDYIQNKNFLKEK